MSRQSPWNEPAHHAKSSVIAPESMAERSSSRSDGVQLRSKPVRKIAPLRIGGAWPGYCAARKPLCLGYAAMDDDSHVIDKGWDALPDYAKSGDADDAPTVSISTTPGEWLVN